MLPIFTPFITTTFWPSEQRSPITASGITWQKCQILVPAPTFAPLSTKALSWMNAFSVGHGIVACHSWMDRTVAARLFMLWIASHAALAALSVVVYAMRWAIAACLRE